MDTTDPSITFDEKGVCDHCHDFESKLKPQWNPGDFNSPEINDLIEQIKQKGKNKEFDCILGLSGGIDSSYLLHVAIREFDLRPLVFHVDAGWNSELAVHNINVLVEKLGVDLYTEVINWEEIKDFQLAYFKSGVPHLDIPQDHAFIATLYNFAKKNKIKYILNGGNFSTECVQYPMEWFYYGTDMVHNNDIIKKFGTVAMNTYPFSSIFRHKIYLRYIKGVRRVMPLNLIHYNKKTAADLLQNEYKWKPYPQKHFESRFTKFYEGYWLPERFGYDTRKVQLSSLILTDQLTREEALGILKKPAYDPTTIKDEFDYIATKLGISPEEMEAYKVLPKRFYWDYKNSQNIFRFGAKVLHYLGIEKTSKRTK